MDYSIPKLHFFGAAVSGICDNGSTATGGTYGSCADGENLGDTVNCNIGDAADPTCNTGNEANSPVGGNNGCWPGNSAINRCGSGNQYNTGQEVCSTGTTADISE